ncbi:MAG: alpha/beta hydrolase [Burkholderiaceae bacterium]|jgi:pimeloyl-ACP methyl ester carboxylesterase|nr:alpha/beta hydrolase [Burkholderiaceae bacterium]
MSVEFAEIDWRGRAVRIEYEWVGPRDQAEERAPLIFLHEGLGSRAMWRDFPAQLCAAAGLRGLVYSRPGYGRSTPRAPGEFWDADFMHRQAYEVLPALLQALQVNRPPWLLGHSDGGSIALLYAARYQAAGVIALAPHLFVEDICIANIERAKTAYESTDLPQRLARYHDDPDSAFWGWCRIWLHPPFRHWNITEEIRAIACPVLAVQGVDDEYGTLEQIRRIARQIPGTQLLELPACGHSAHKDQPEAVIQAAAAFMRRPAPTEANAMLQNNATCC